MRTTVSPKQAARAMEVSESSVKRWCDRGDIPAETTPGGHRRIPIQGLLEFLEGSGRTLARPDLLGLRVASRPGPRATRQVASRLREALLAGNETRVQAVLLDARLSGHSAVSIGDEIVAPTFESIGELWECGSAEVYQERHSCELANRGLEQLRQLTPPHPEGRIAMGGTFEGDYYGLATVLVELVLRERGWSASSLGCNLPAETMSASIASRRPSLFWISASHVSNPAQFQATVETLAERHPETTVVVGGRMVTPELRANLTHARSCGNLAELEQLAAAMDAASQASGQTTLK